MNCLRHLLPWLAAGLIPLRTPAQQAPRFEPVATRAGQHWFKGNTHTHTLNSDGDSPPDTVIQWYKSRGYHFLVLSDHDTITQPATFARYLDSAFILVTGEEVTGRFNRLPVHLTALNPGRIIKPNTTSTTVLAALQSNIDAIRAAGGVPLINHPNYRWVLNRETIAAANGIALFELFNGHPHVHNQGGGAAPSTEELWDQLLTGGKRIFGVASDDAHHWKQWGREQVNPGKGWIWVSSDRLDPATIVNAIASGQFYSSTGPELEDIAVTDRSIEIRIKPELDFRYAIEFIGSNGRVLQRSDGLTARYELKPGISYVRVRVTDSGGRAAWTQPVFVQRD
jgi:hypothetical protein